MTIVNFTGQAGLSGLFLFFISFRMKLRKDNPPCGGQNDFRDSHNFMRFLQAYLPSCCKGRGCRISPLLTGSSTFVAKGSQ
jgi:hypothetical protein